jgi:DNA repair exonuclease SbcCD ATPase subunit
MDFSDGLNCVIGGRGTGKTTVLEALCFALDRMPNETVDGKRHEALEKLLQANLGTGSIKLELETADGILYSVARAFGETPLVTNADGKPVHIRIGHDMHSG